ncbi:FAD-dependent oxidoreductase [Paracoccus sp. MBLB3053]|uniref:FAD-dependent oxidoreductase n=1 Tax=Paracoccus aurantius TaxID=3073814 RepID=A0ABU2HVV3_9RHOB|nr:FAD-dependent oxidoreductase [Paracoccus sp. MBLB3053]MDS9469182.1 FAD-dependent oxidoreductase [Paracoccus sp. MBLB3053]
MARHGYDRLIIATGARNAPPPFPGRDAPGVFGMRTLANAARMRERLATTHHAVVVGSGLIGLKIAAMARMTEISVTVIEAAPRLIAGAFRAISRCWRPGRARRRDDLRSGPSHGRPSADRLPDRDLGRPRL